MATSNDQLLHCLAPRPMPTTDRRWRGSADHPAPNCPRCASPHTKFCYYNNYSLSQPRYFCKGCRRYWTKGGSLRNVPVGGGCRKSRRSRSNKNGSSQHGLGPRPTLDSSSESSQESGGPNIDLAVVFAKFLNQNDNNASHEEINVEPTTNTPSEGSHDSLTSSSYGFENGFETLDQEFQMTEGLGLTSSDQKQLIQEEDHQGIQGFISPELASFDDIIEDVFWSDESNLSNFTWQPVAQLQDFDSPLLPVDQFKGSTNQLSCDNWSYFDTTGFEVFSKP